MSPSCGSYGSVAVANIPNSAPFRTTIPISMHALSETLGKVVVPLLQILFDAKHLLLEPIQTGQALDRLLWRIYQLATPFGHVGKTRRATSQNSLQCAGPSNFSSIRRSPNILRHKALNRTNLDNSSGSSKSQGESTSMITLADGIV